MMKTLITGGAGFIGSHLVNYLVRQNEQVVVIDDMSGSNLGAQLETRDEFKKVQFIQGSILDKELISEVMKSVTKCFHLGAVLGVQKINENPLNALEVNVVGTEVVLNAASKNHVRVILASSSEVYGRNKKMPLSENSDRVLGTPEVARWTYSEAKALNEFLAFYLFKNQNLPVTIARFFNTVGPGQNEHYGTVMPKFVNAALSNSPIVIFGDGSQTRTFCSVDDVIEALVLLGSSDKTLGMAFNVGSNAEISILELAKKIIMLTRSESQIIFKKHEEIFGRNFEEPTRRVPDLTKISSTIGWQAKKNLDQIIEEVVNYSRHK